MSDVTNGGLDRTSPATSDSQTPDELVNPYRAKRFMPPDFNISIGEKGGSDRLLTHPGHAQKHNMRGFEPQYTDIVDYIVRVTHRIWEDKEIIRIPPGDPAERAAAAALEQLAEIANTVEQK